MKPTYEMYEEWWDKYATEENHPTFEEWKRAWEEDEKEEAAVLAEILWEEGRR